MMKRILSLIILILFLTPIFLNSKNIQVASLTQSDLKKVIKKRKIYHRKSSKKRYKRYRYYKTSYILPLKGRVFRNNIRKGIFISPKYYRKVKNVNHGRVIFVGYLKYFGNVIIIKHRNNYKSVYAYLEKVYVKKGEYVPKGKYIGILYKNTPLYFELRKKVKCVRISSLKRILKIYNGIKLSRRF